MQGTSSTQEMTETSCGAQQRNCFAKRAALQQSVPHVLSRTALNNHDAARQDRLLLFRVTVLSSVVSSLGQIWSQWWDNPSFCHTDTHKRATKKWKNVLVMMCFSVCLPFQFSHQAFWRIPADSLTSGCSCSTEHTGEWIAGIHKNTMEYIWQFKKKELWVWPKLTAVPVRIRVPSVTSQGDLQTLLSCKIRDICYLCQGPT